MATQPERLASLEAKMVQALKAIEKHADESRASNVELHRKIDEALERHGRRIGALENFKSFANGAGAAVTMTITWVVGIVKGWW